MTDLFTALGLNSTVFPFEDIKTTSSKSGRRRRLEYHKAAGTSKLVVSADYLWQDESKMSTYSGKATCRSYTESFEGAVKEAFGYAFPVHETVTRPGLFCSSTDPGKCRIALAALGRGRAEQAGNGLGSCTADGGRDGAS